MKTFLIIYTILGIMWAAFEAFTIITGKFQSKWEKDLLENLKKVYGPKKYGAYLTIATVMDIPLWPISIISNMIMRKIYS